MNRLTAEWVLKAVEIIRSGLAQKLEKDGVTVYSCGKIIRIDIKDSVKVEMTEKDEADDVWPEPPDENDRHAYPACGDDMLDDLPW